MTIEELCNWREELLGELAWIELLITRTRDGQTCVCWRTWMNANDRKAERLNNAAEYFPRVPSVDKPRLTINRNILKR